MTFLIVGLVLIALAFAMIRMARPQPNGHPAAFLEATGLIVPYVVAFTAAVGVGIAFTVAGIISIVQVAS